MGFVIAFIEMQSSKRNFNTETIHNMIKFTGESNVPFLRHCNPNAFPVVNFEFLTVFTGKLEIYLQRFIFVIGSLFIKMVFTLYIFNIYCILAATKCQLSSLSHNRHNLYFFKCQRDKKTPIFFNCFFANRLNHC
jgi:hypothetical protein